MESRQDSGHRRGILIQQRLPVCVKNMKAELPQALLPAFFHLQQSCTLSDSEAGEAPESENLRLEKAGRLTLLFMPRVAIFFLIKNLCKASAFLISDLWVSEELIINLECPSGGVMQEKQYWRAADTKVL